jgi:hypothetical protein
VKGQPTVARLAATAAILLALLGGSATWGSAASTSPTQPATGSSGLPYLSREGAAALAKEKQHPQSSSAPVRGELTSPSASPLQPQHTPPGSGLGNTPMTGSSGGTLLTGFAGTTHDYDVTNLGSGSPNPQNVRPPDDNVGVSGSTVAEVVNSALSLYSRGGSPIGSPISLYSLFPPPSSGVCWQLGSHPITLSDPRIEYDPGQGRWYLSAAELAYPASGYTGGSCVVLMVSKPAGSPGCSADISTSPSCWYSYAWRFDAGSIDDQPRPGYSDDKVVISWNDFSFSGGYLGEETWVLQKADLLGGTLPGNGLTQLFGGDVERFSIVPAQSVSSTSDEWAVYNNSDATNGEQNTSYPSLGMIRITGTPAAGNVGWQEYDPGIVATSIPPTAVQAGTTVELDTGDDRLLGAVWEYGRLWTTADDACTINSVPRACGRFIEADASGADAAIVPGEDWDLGLAGDDVAYPAATFDGAGDMVASVSISSASLYPSMAVLGQLDGSSNGPNFLEEVTTGTTAYYSDTTGCAYPCVGVARWGDYGGAAYDPSDSHGAWVSAEFATTNAVPAPSNDDWATYIQDVDASGPGPQGFSLSGAGNPVAVLTPNGGQKLLFWQGPSDHHLYEAWYGFQSAQWSGPADLSAQLGISSNSDANLASAPTVTFTPDGGQQLVFWEGANQDLWEAWYSYEFGNWQVQDLTQIHHLVGAGGVGSAPTVTFSPGGGQQLVFWEGTNHDLWEAWYSVRYGVWQSQDLSTSLLKGVGAGTLASAPSVILTPGGGQQLAFWRSTDDHVWEAWYSVEYQLWQVQDLTAAHFPGAASVASQPNVILTPGGGQQLVFYEASSGDLWEAWYTLSASTWQSMDLTTTRLGGLGSLASEPMVTVSPDGTLQLVFWQTSGGHLDEAWYSLTSSSWSDEDLTAGAGLPVGAALNGPPAPLLLASGEQDVWWQGASQSLWELRYGRSWTDWSA